MNVFIVLKSGIKDATYFIQQLSNQSEVDKVVVFRDEEAMPLSKVEYIISPFRKFKLLNQFLRFVQILNRRKFSPEVIVGIYEIPHGLIAVLTGLLLRKKTVVSITGNPAYKKLRKGFRMHITMWILKRASFVTVTGTLSRKFLIDVGIDGKKVLVLPNTMDFNGFNPIPTIQKEYDIISLGRLSDEKRLDQLLHLVYALKKDYPSIRVGIAGTGPEKELLLNLSSSLNLENNISFLGYVPDEELTNFFSKGKIFVLTSETEGFPRTIIQAAACGIPVIASNVGDMTDVIEHGKNGFLVDKYNDIESYVRYCKVLFTDQIIYNSFSNNLNVKVRESFDTKNAFKIWKVILNSLK